MIFEKDIIKSMRRMFLAANLGYWNVVLTGSTLEEARLFMACYDKSIVTDYLGYKYDNGVSSLNVSIEDGIISGVNFWV